MGNIDILANELISEYQSQVINLVSNAVKKNALYLKSSVNAMIEWLQAIIK